MDELFNEQAADRHVIASLTRELIKLRRVIMSKFVKDVRTNKIYRVTDSDEVSVGQLQEELAEAEQAISILRELLPQEQKADAAPAAEQAVAPVQAEQPATPVADVATEAAPVQAEQPVAQTPVEAATPVQPVVLQ